MCQDIIKVTEDMVVVYSDRDKTYGLLQTKTMLYHWTKVFF